MRVLEPHQIKRPNNRKKHALPNKKAFKTGFIIAVLAGGYLLFGQRSGPIKSLGDDSKQEVAAVATAPPKLKYFTAEQFKAAYNSYIYPNTQPILTPPRITGNEAADARIRGLAEKRGYKLTSVPVSSIVKTEEAGLQGDDLIQPNALMAWQNLRDEAAKSGLKLKLT